MPLVSPFSMPFTRALAAALRRYRGVATALAIAAVATAAPARAAADDPEDFVREQHRRIELLLHEPVSTTRDARIHDALGSFVDYDELTHRAFGEPCPRAEPSCEDLWSGYNDDQRAELRVLLEQLVRKTYRRNLTKTLDYDVDYRGMHEAGGDSRVLTEAKNRLKPREPPVRVDYVVKQTPAGPKVVDIITEGSSLTKNYYDQFRKKMHNPNEGYANIVQKLREKIAKND
ncbi:MAG: ABC transporter substrate-binding protein [Polyangiaceae bacterium]|nr:ABC transporter substrate-binding protein [Polyangiaceae bacterium]